MTHPGVILGTGKPVSRRKRFYFPYRGSIPTRLYDLSPDGKRFLVPERPQKKPVEIVRLNLVQNWAEEVKRAFLSGK